MSTVENKELFRSYVEEVFNRGNTDAIERYLSPTFVDHTPFLAGEAPGPAGTRQWVQELHKAFGDFHATLESVISEGDMVASRGTLSGVHRASFMGIPPTNKRVSWQVIAFLRIANGRIVERWAVQDTLGLLRQLGVSLESVGVPAAS